MERCQTAPSTSRQVRLAWIRWVLLTIEQWLTNAMRWPNLIMAKTVLLMEAGIMSPLLTPTSRRIRDGVKKALAGY